MMSKGLLPPRGGAREGHAGVLRPSAKVGSEEWKRAYGILDPREMMPGVADPASGCGKGGGENSIVLDAARELGVGRKLS